MTRREFLHLASGIVVLFHVGGMGRAFAAGTVDNASPADFNAWVAIGEDGRVSIFAPMPDAGEGLRTELAQLAAEELSLSVSAVKVVLGDTDRVPAMGSVCPSEAITNIGQQVRKAAAQARETLAAAAAQQWGVDRAAVAVRNGRVELVSDTEQWVAIGELAGCHRLPQVIKGEVPLKPVDSYEVVGTSLPRLEGLAFVRGEATYVGDLRLERMAYGRVLRPPCLGAQLVRVDTRAAASQPGVLRVVDAGDFVGVVATRPDLAERALLSVQASWDEPEQVSMGTLYRQLRATAKLDKQLVLRGDVEAVLAASPRGYSASYRVPFAAHAPIEPHGAVADPRGDGMVMYASTQHPFLHRDAVAKALDLGHRKVHVIVPAIGGAFGGKEEIAYSVEAARLARAVGRPVMVTQSREEELAWNSFQPAALIDVRSGLTGAGRIRVWDCDVFNCGARGATPPYEFESVRVRTHTCRTPLPQGSWPRRGGMANAFAREVHLDHIAAELGEDPVALRLRHLEGRTRMKQVVEDVANRFGWRDRYPPTGLGAGFACAEDAGSCAAVVAEVEVERSTGLVRVRRVLVAQDSGLIVNPDNARNLIEGAVVRGLGSSLTEIVRYEQSRVLTRSFATYQIPSFADAPTIEVILAPNEEHPPQATGMVALCAVPAAVANAVFDAVGKRLRELPLLPGRVRCE